MTHDEQHEQDAHAHDEHDADAHDEQTSDTYLVGIERPVFAGDWASASNSERTAHMRLIKAWKEANEGPGSQRSKTVLKYGSTTPSEQAERHAADLATLDGIIGSSKALNSDRIRALEAKQRILAKVEAEEREREHGPLIDLRLALDTLPAHERVAALGELLGVGDTAPEHASE